MATFYEWTFEIVQVYEDGENDIIDSDFYDTYADAQRVADRVAEEGFSEALPDAQYRLDVGVARRVYDRSGDLVETSWAYIEDGVLPERFEDALGRPGARVPVRFHAELKRAAR